jgi:WD40 repeat protein
MTLLNRITQFAAQLAALTLFCSSLIQAAETKPSDSKTAAIAITEIKRTAAVDFEKEILPLFKSNCLACHNQTKAKADLVLETPQTILKGGESGPAVVPGRSAESLLLKAAAHQADPAMPPRDNKVNAIDLTSDQLGVLKLWIDQGAKGEVKGSLALEWKPLPEGLNPIFAVALSSDGQFAACGRANQIFIYHVPSGQLVGRLTDPDLLKTGIYNQLGVAHRDMVHSLAFSPDGMLLASGDYRQAKIWRRPANVQKLHLSMGPSNSVPAVTISRDGKWIAAARDDKKIKLWNLANGKDAKLLAGHEKAITSLKFSPDGTKLASSSADKTIRVWDVQEGELLAKAAAASEVNAVTWVAEGKQVASGGADNVIRVWKLSETATGELAQVRELKGHEGAVTALETWPSNGNEILSGSADGSLRHWNIESEKQVQVLKHGGPVAAVAIRSDGKRFASSGLNSVAKLWDAKDGKAVAELKGDRYAVELVGERERGVTFAGSEISYRKTSLASTEKEQQAQKDRVQKATEAQETAAKAFAEKEKLFTSAKDAKASAEKALVDLNAEVKKATEDYQAADKVSKLAGEQAKKAVEKAMQAKIPADQAAETKTISERLAIDAAAVAAKIRGSASHEAEPAGKAAAEKTVLDTAAFAQKAKNILENVAADAAAKSKIADESKTLAEKAIDEVAAKAFVAGQLKPAFDKITADAPARKKQADEKVAATTKALTDGEKEFKKAEMAKSNAENELQLAKKSVDQAAESVTLAKNALKAAEEQQKQAEADLQTAKKSAIEFEKAIRAIAFSPDNRTLATAGDDNLLHTWDAENGAPFESFKGHQGPVLTIAFIGRGDLVSGSTDASAIVWDINAEWRLERILGTGDAASQIVDRVNAVRFSPDSKWLATGSGEPSRSGEIKVFQVADGKLLKDLKNVHSDAVFSLDFSADGKYLASGAADKFVKVVDVATEKIVKSFEGHTHHVLGVSWKRDGRTLASAGADNVIKVWDFITGERKKNVEGFGKEVTAISFIGITDQAVACSGDNQVRTIKENGDKVRSFDGVNDFMYSVAATPDGKIIIAGGQDSVLRIWNGADGKSIATFAPPAANPKLAVKSEE